MYLIRKQNRIIQANTIKTEYEQSVIRLQATVRGFLVRRANQKTSIATLTIQKYWRMWYDRTRFKIRLLQYRNQQIQISYFLKQVELSGSHLYQQLTNQISINEDKKSNENQSIPKQTTPSKLQNTLGINTKRKVVVLCEYYDAIYKEFINKKNKKFVEEIKKEKIDNTIVKRPSTAPAIGNIPQAPPCPPPEFFKQTKTEPRVYNRQKSAPATVTNAVEELKQIFATKK
jgi:hypothetical protein